MDVIIIGGGVGGLSVAAHLAPHASVTLLEAEAATGYHASGRSAALFDTSYGHPTSVELNKASQPFHHAAGVLSPRGLMVVADTNSTRAFATDCEVMGLAPITVDEALFKMPILRADRVAQAGYHAEAWDIDTHELMMHFTRTARRNGAQIVTKAAATAITRVSSKWQVTTAVGGLRADIIVNAAGAWADKVAEMAGVAPLGITPLRRSMARLPAPGGQDVSGWPMTLGAGETWYAKPDAGSLLVSPADQEPCAPMDAWPDDMVLAEGLARYEAMVTQPVTRVDASWAGLRSFTPDRAMAIGFDPAEPGFFWHAGQGGSGFQTAPAAGKLAAALIAGHAPDIPDDLVAALSPHRFR
ncbi:glycerol-3-phosphate dehydrogenase [Actibacterium mucosum KCTC 23349]|uniref:Glycerol-3-phosphate dehydrogenase n=1 Tax=Actibacterium mucosum KCTC 23349 TaxID=1454373 RepID=A0A037ZG10_9RHOB|nr:FAD-dependent oxidoreductase [Actibacterium mucosum]KAJ55083.1 glycerol-3-phosphate dehydrogenase [Actibacterium mucosum KCTC 23349]